MQHRSQQAAAWAFYRPKRPGLRGSGGVQFPACAYTELGHGRIRTGKRLAGWRKTNQGKTGFSDSDADTAHFNGNVQRAAAFAKREYGVRLI